MSRPRAPLSQIQSLTEDITYRSTDWQFGSLAVSSRPIVGEGKADRYCGYCCHWCGCCCCCLSVCRSFGPSVDRSMGPSWCLSTCHVSASWRVDARNRNKRIQRTTDSEHCYHVVKWRHSQFFPSAAITSPTRFACNYNWPREHHHQRKKTHTALFR